VPLSVALLVSNDWARGVPFCALSLAVEVCLSVVHFIRTPKGWRVDLP